MKVLCWNLILTLLFVEIILSQIDWRKVKKEKIHCIYDEYQKTDIPREIQASKLDEYSATKLP